MSPAPIGQIVYGSQTVQQLSIHVDGRSHDAAHAMPPDLLETAAHRLERRIEALRMRVAILPIMVCAAAGALAAQGIHAGLDRGERLGLLVALLILCASQAWWWAGGWWLRQRDALRAARQQRVRLLAQARLGIQPTGGHARRRSLT